MDFIVFVIFEVTSKQKLEWWSSLYWCCVLFFKHWRADCFKWRPLVTASLLTQNSNLPYMTGQRLLSQSCLWWTLKYCGGVWTVNTADPQDICLTSFLIEDFLSPPKKPHPHTMHICGTWAGLRWQCKLPDTFHWHHLCVFSENVRVHEDGRTHTI